jgi:hypothetical protein
MAKKTIAPATISEVRTWLVENGYKVGARGRISAALKADFTKETKRSVA